MLQEPTSCVRFSHHIPPQEKGKYFSPEKILETLSPFLSPIIKVHGQPSRSFPELGPSKALPFLTPFFFISSCPIPLLKLTFPKLI